jgi:DNA mismatch endonuclease, patch repair protein
VVLMTPEEIKIRMSKVRQKDTGIELALRSALHRRGLRYRKNVKSLPGSPDIVFPKYRLVVFVDGDFWHGWKFAERSDRLKPFWREKVARNIERDERDSKRLEEMGWRVLRVWEHDVKRRLPEVVATVEAVLQGQPLPPRQIN